MQVYTCRCACAGVYVERRGQCRVVLLYCSLDYFQQGPSLDLKLTNSVRPDGQPVSGMCLSLLPTAGIASKHAPAYPALAFVCVLRILAHVLTLVWQAFYQPSHLPSPRFPAIRDSGISEHLVIFSCFLCELGSEKEKPGFDEGPKAIFIYLLPNRKEGKQPKC